jgi:hypothetical protein
MVPHCQATHPEAHVRIQSTPKTTRGDDQQAHDQPRACSATEHARSTPKHPGNAPRSTGDATEHTEDNKGDDEQAHDQSRAMSAATEHGRKPTKRLKQHDHGHQRTCHDVTLSQQTAQAIADSFFKFVVQEHLQQHLSRMSAGQILVLCIFHSRRSWQKGKPLQLHERDHYWIPKPSYTPASQVNAPSPPHFVQRIQHSATEHVPPEMQPPCSCCLCG